jgi:hypothetical protein
MPSKDLFAGPPAGPTVLGLALPDRILVIVGAPALGLALGYFLPRTAKWVVTLPWAPLRGPLKLVASLQGSWVGIAVPAAGLVLGIVLAWFVIAESLTVTLTAAEIRLAKGDGSRTIARADVDAVFLDGDKLVVLDRESRQLVREKFEGTAAAAARSFRSHGYPWVDEDPYAELFRRWVPGTPDLPSAVNAVLSAREVVLKKKAADEIAELRDEVQKLGFVVRDNGVRQYWRPLVRS